MIKIGKMSYGLCVSKSIEDVKEYYKKIHGNLRFDFEDVTEKYDFPVMEINVSQKVRDVIK